MQSFAPLKATQTLLKKNHLQSCEKNTERDSVSQRLVLQQAVLSSAEIWPLLHKENLCGMTCEDASRI